MPMEYLDNASLRGYIELFAGRGFSFNEFLEVLKEDFKDTSIIDKNIKEIKAKYRTILKEINK